MILPRWAKSEHGTQWQDRILLSDMLRIHILYSDMYSRTIDIPSISEESPNGRSRQGYPEQINHDSVGSIEESLHLV